MKRIKTNIMSFLAKNKNVNQINDELDTFIKRSHLTGKVDYDYNIIGDYASVVFTLDDTNDNINHIVKTYLNIDPFCSDSYTLENANYKFHFERIFPSKKEIITY